MSRNAKPTVVDEDVDDLDDVLEQFTPAQKPTTSNAAASSTASPAIGSNAGPGRPPAGLENLDISGDFARELAEGMAALMREIAVEAGEKAEGESGTQETSKGPDAPQTQEELQREAAFRKAWENMLVEGMNGALDTTDFGTSKKGKGVAMPGDLDASKADIKDDTFQASIRKAMDKLKESDTALHVDSASGADPFEALLSQLGDGGGETEDELHGILEGMMAQLMSKDVLYEPLKELGEKFPKYLADNAATLSEEDKKRFESQRTIVAKVLAVFEDPAYTPEDQQRGITIVTLMNEMQALGSPPAEIMGPLPPGMDLGDDGMPKLPDSCIVS